MEDNELRAAVHEAVQAALHEDGLVISWMVVAEVTDGENKNLTQIAGGGHDGADEPTAWQRMGMAEAVVSIIREHMLSNYWDSRDEPDEDEEAV